MSNTGKNYGSPNAPRTPAAGVAFTSVDGHNPVESSSMAESRSSLGKRSSTSDRRSGEHRDGESSPMNGDIQGALGSVARRAKKRGGFLLESAFSNQRPKSPESSKSRGKRSEHNGHIHVDKKLSSHRFSAESSQRGSPLSREMSLDGSTNKEDDVRDSSVRPPAMDPAQLVQMALSLSESRKRNVSNALQVPTSPSSKKTNALGPGTSHGSVRVPRPESHAPDDDKTRSPRLGGPRQSNQDAMETQNLENGTVYTFSPATLSRAEKARKYFELASEYRRLLEHLPPLRPVAPVSGNSKSNVRNSPASTQGETPQMSLGTTPKQGLGRVYNPLQALRNRRLRNRERRPLTAPPDTWQETDRIKNWIDDVAAGCTDPGYLSGDDQVRLPQFEGDSHIDNSQQASGKGHHRSNTVSSIVTRPENGWTIEPAELLADIYWIEKDDNKTIVQDREGRRIFPARSKPVADTSRQGKESDMHMDGQFDENHDSENDGSGRRKRKNMLHIPDRLRRPHLSRTVSTTSNTSDEGRKPRLLQFGTFEGGDENIGPLERHMKEMIAKDERGELSSPEHVSPDHWDSSNTHFPVARDNIGRVGREIAHAKNRLSVDTHRHRRSHSADVHITSPDNGMSSMDELVSDSAASLTLPSFGPSAAMDFSPPSSKHASPIEGRSGKARPAVTSSQSRERNKAAHADLAGRIGTPLSPVLSGDDSLAPISSPLSADMSRPNHKRNLTSGSSGGSSLHRLNTSGTLAPSAVSSSAKDPASASAGRRFFKSGRIGEIVRNESARLGDRFRTNRERLPGVAPGTSDISRNGSDNSDTEDESARGRVAEKGELSKEASPRTSLEVHQRPRPKYYISNLPSFKSPVGRERRAAATPPYVEQDPISQQQKIRRARGRSPRFERLAPPRIRLPDDDTVSNSDVQTQDSNAYLRPGRSYRSSISARNSADDLRLIAGGFDGKLPQGRRMAIGGPPQAKRHWSISDRAYQPKQADERINAREVARVRALLLASGIKAREILQKADDTRNPPSTMLREAAATTERPESSVRNVPRKEEHVLAARMLSDALTSRFSSFSTSIDNFHLRTAADLMQDLTQLRNRAGDQLTSLVHETSDDADAFNVELTTKQPQDVKRVDDAVDAMFRQRRRQFRWLRRSGFKILEWLVLGLMWWVWFVVVIINTVKRMVVGVGKGVRWLIWF